MSGYGNAYIVKNKTQGKEETTMAEGNTPIKVIRYNETSYEEYTPSTAEDSFKDGFKGVTWINVEGLQDAHLIEAIGQHLHLHPLLIEDIRNTEQRPKIDEFEGYIFLIIKMLSLEADEVKEEQVSLVVMKDTIVSFQERPGDVFGPFRDRIRTGKGIARKLGSDYLLYALLDAIVDEYFTVLEKIGDKIESLEGDLVENPTPKVLKELHKARREMIALRRGVWPLRGVVDMIDRCDNPVIGEHMAIYFRDIYDHTVQIIDAIETNRDVISSILDVYLTSINNKMNEVMKFLTIVGTIFMPLSFVASLYGMNFRFMPEIEQVWGYPFALAVMLLTAVAMLYYFRKKKWI